MKSSRLYWLDCARFILIICMIIYHTYWDLSYFHLIKVTPEYNKYWRYFAHFTAAGFLTISGFSLTLSYYKKRNTNFTKRFIKLLFAALCISLITYYIFPNDYIYFGILHQICTASLLQLVLFQRSIIFNSLIALFLFSFKVKFILPPALAWLGISTNIPASVDFVPIFPWTGWVIIGSILARLYLKHPIATSNKTNKLILWVSKHSLTIYLLHQPIIFTTLWLFTYNNFNQQSFRQSCLKHCELGVSCSNYCNCMEINLHNNNFPQAVKKCIS